MVNTLAIKRSQFVADYYQLLDENDYYIIDLNMVEPFFIEDKQYHPSNIVFERNYNLLAIRSDWTRSILNYRSLYHLPTNRLGYYGPIIRDNQTTLQAGIELYQTNAHEIIQSTLLHFDLIQVQSPVRMQTLIVNDEKIINLYLEKYQLDEKVRDLIYEKDISGMAELIGLNHPLYQLMILPVSQQFPFISQEFTDHPLLKTFNQFREATKSYGVKFIFDLSFRSPQPYYNGFYFQLFLNENLPVLSGGQYAESAFGIAINLSNGGLL